MDGNRIRFPTSRNRHWAIASYTRHGNFGDGSIRFEQHEVPVQQQQPCVPLPDTRPTRAAAAVWFASDLGRLHGPSPQSVALELARSSRRRRVKAPSRRARSRQIVLSVCYACDENSHTHSRDPSSRIEGERLLRNIVLGRGVESSTRGRQSGLPRHVATSSLVAERSWN